MENASTTILHISGATPAAVETALTAIFALEERPCVLRLEGTYRAVLARVLAPELAAAYRYLICRPHPASAWTPLVELGNRTDGLDVELSRALDGAAVCTTFVYDAGTSGYRLARGGRLVDQYVSDPTLYADEEPSAAAIAAQRGDPARFADLLPVGTAPEDFSRIVLRPGWWEAYDAREAGERAPTEDPLRMGPTTPDAEVTAPTASEAAPEAAPDEEDEVVDEVDRMRCIALALELWGPQEYPFAQELDTLANNQIGPAIALAFA